MNIAKRIELWPVSRLKPYERNARTHDDAQVAKIAASIAEFGFTNPILVDSQDGIIAGHGRLMAANVLGLADVPVIMLDHLTDAQRRAYILADNRLALDAGWDNEMLAQELAALQDDGFDMELTGFTDDELAGLLDFANDNAEDGQAEGGEQKKNLSDRFLLPPFTVLNAREGWWQSRKDAWLSLGIKSELGRGDKAEEGGNDTGGLLMKSWTSHPDFYQQKTKKEQELGRELSTAEFLESHFVPPTDGAYSSGTSIFDPVLCEIAYRWFCPPGGTVLDPFAGGSVRGIVGAKLGRQYIGMELRAEQVEANRAQCSELCADDEQPPAWICGDSRNIDTACADVEADLLFTCPPYADLEVYSDDARDLSTMAYADFRHAYREIIAKSCARLRQDRFAVCVVGDVRDKRGNYLDFVGETVQAFRDAGLHYYNEAILVTSVGSLPIRAGKQFSASRKLGKTHQNVLVFVKGDGKRAARACGEVDVSGGLETVEASGA